MPSDQTRTAILAAAERLYADRGFGDVTLRDIVSEANVNLAAVNYHFGSKDELIAELFVTRSLALNKERLRELREAEDAGGGHADISEVLRALVGPTLRGCARSVLGIHLKSRRCATTTRPSGTQRSRPKPPATAPEWRSTTIEPTFFQPIKTPSTSTFGGSMRDSG